MKIDQENFSRHPSTSSATARALDLSNNSDIKSETSSLFNSPQEKATANRDTKPDKNTDFIDLDTYPSRVTQDKSILHRPISRRGILKAIALGAGAGFLGGTFLEPKRSRAEPEVSKETILSLTHGVIIQKGDTLQMLLAKDLPPGEIENLEDLQKIFQMMHEEINGDTFYEGKSYRLLNQYALYTLTDVYENKNKNTPSFELNHEMNKLKKTHSQQDRRLACINILNFLKKAKTLPAPIKPPLFD